MLMKLSYKLSNMFSIGNCSYHVNDKSERKRIIQILESLKLIVLQLLYLSIEQLLCYCIYTIKTITSLIMKLCPHVMKK